MHALLSDVAQRLLTLNKLQQKRSLSQWLRRLELRSGARALDFGCGTGLFATTMCRAGLEYRGYDPDPAAVAYARRLYPQLSFVSRLDAAAAAAPFDVVIANCCFHHISDDELVEATLPAIAGLMHRTSRFLLIDVLPLGEDASSLRRLYNLLEVGDRKRTPRELDSLLSTRFTVRSCAIERLYVLAAATRANPLYNDTVAYELTLA